MQRTKSISAGRGERGIVILMVAVVLLFVVGAMAALSIDVVTFYTARSEVQMAADGAALAGARVLSNSGVTSDPNANTDGLMTNTETLASTIATEVAMRNVVGGRTLVPASGEVTVNFNDVNPSNPRVTVQTKRTDIPTFFARIWGNATVTVQASATAEAYNPSGANALVGVVTPVAPACVKPWVLPNISPPGGTNPQIIDPTTGAILDTSLVDRDISGTLFALRCGPGGGPQGCNNATWLSNSPPAAWQYYPGDQSSFPAPAAGLPSCPGSINSYQESIMGCVESPIACGTTINLDGAAHTQRHQDTKNAINCLTSAKNDAADSVDVTSTPPTAPYQFLAGADNPLVQAGTIAAGTDVMVSNSIVTVPLYDSGSGTTPPPTTVTVIGFVQLFLNQAGVGATNAGSATRVINIAGCGTGATGQPIMGNGASPIPVRLITPP